MKGLNDQFIKTYGIHEQTPHIEKEVDAIELLSARRLDLVAKYAYILYKQRGYASDYAEKVYHHHIDILTQGTFHEFGDSDKNSYEKFITVFDSLMEDIKTHGFDSTKSLVPLSKDMVPLNGAHRISCCLYFHQKIRVICFPEINPVNLNYQFFRKKGMIEEYLDFMVYHYIRLKPDTVSGCCIWTNKIQDILMKLPYDGDIVYCKKIDVTSQGLMKLYKRIKGKESDERSLHQEVKKLHDEYKNCYYVVYEQKQDTENLSVRCGLDKTHLYHTKTPEECLALSEVVLNKHSFHLLNHSDDRLIAELNNPYFKGKTLDAASTLYLYGVDHSYGLHLCTDLEPCAYDPDETFSFFGVRLLSLPYIIEHYPPYAQAARQLWNKAERKKPKGLWFKKLYGKVDYGVYLILNRLHIYNILWKIFKRN